MNNLTEFLQKHFHWLIFVLLEVFSLVLLFNNKRYEGSVAFSSANAVVSSIYSLISSVEQYMLLPAASQQLTERNVYLEQRVANLVEELRRAKADSLSLPTYQAAVAPLKQIPAHVISNSLDRRDNLITIDRGSADGVKVNMGVVSGRGIVGVVYLVGKHNSVVLPLLNTQSHISCAISGTDYFGFLHWEGGYCHMAYVDDIPRHAKLHKGDYVVTSGYSAIFPRGLIVGQVRYVFNSPDGLSYRLKIELATDFANLRDVCVLDNSRQQEQIELMRAAQDSLHLITQQ